MPRFHIFSTDRSQSAQLVAPNAAEVLNVVHRLGLNEADVERDGEYSFSVRLDGNGLWCVYQRGQGEGPKGIEAFG